MADETKPETPAPKIVPQTGEATAAAAASKPAPAAGATASAPATGANPAATPNVTTTPAARPVPAPGAPVAGAAAAATSHPPTTPAARPAPVPRPPAAPIPDLGGKTTSVASVGGAVKPAASAAVPRTAAAAASGRAPDDSSPLLTRRAWMGLAWGAFSAASAAALAATGRFMFPNVLNEPPQQFKAGFPNEYGMGVDERWKEKFGIWIVRVPDDIAAHASGFYALITVCTHLGCTPNYLSAENKFKCPCHGSGYRLTGVNFEGPAPRPLERARIVLADDGQILVDKSRHFQYELGQWTDPEAFLKA
jgi:cytochrome b6-f complex iron-sulfur subunit